MGGTFLIGRGGGFDLLRVVLGGILLLAAGLKAHQLATDPLVTLAPRPSSLTPLSSSLAPLLYSRSFLIGVVECELLFGLVLLGGILPRLTWALSLLCFGGFALISLYKGISGHSTCGCFGRVPVNPWYTFGLDAAAVFALLRWRPRGQSPSHVHTFARSAAVLALWLLVGTPVALATSTEPAGTLNDLGEVLDNGRIVILKPETWVGKRFPLLDYIEIPDNLEVGEWLVLLYHDDCPRCQQVIRDLRGPAGRRNAKHVAFLAMPPYGDSDPIPICSEGTRIYGRLSATREWFAETPVGVMLAHGEVKKSWPSAGIDRLLDGSHR